MNDTTRAYGALEGIITSNPGEPVTLHHRLTLSTVACWLRPDQMSTADGLHGRRIVVEGVVVRDAVTGHPIAIADITHIIALKEPEPGAFQRARGVLPREVGESSPEERIRAGREA